MATGALIGGEVLTGGAQIFQGIEAKKAANRLANQFKTDIIIWSYKATRSICSYSFAQQIITDGYDDSLVVLLALVRYTP